jgi:uncharacterized protein YciI
VKTFIYVLRLVPRLRHENTWTDADNKIVTSHFAFLQELRKAGKLILAGKTDGLDEKTFGIVIIECESLDEAISIQRDDPAVKHGIMSAELFPYTIALASFPH